MPTVSINLKVPDERYNWYRLNVAEAIKNNHHDILVDLMDLAEEVTVTGSEEVM
jgi:hypothetical protein